MFKRIGRLSVGALLAALLFSHIPVAEAKINVDKFVAIIESPGSHDQYWTYFAGAASGILWTTEQISFQMKKRLYCPPNDVARTVAVDYKLLKDYMSAVPRISSQPLPHGVLNALMWKFPCK